MKERFGHHENTMRMEMFCGHGRHEPIAAGSIPGSGNMPRWWVMSDYTRARRTADVA
jgi:hypothetical protein